MNVRIDWSKFPPVEQAANPAQVASIVSASSDRDYVYSVSLSLSLLSDESLWCQAHLDHLVISETQRIAFYQRLDESKHLNSQTFTY